MVQALLLRSCLLALQVGLLGGCRRPVALPKPWIHATYCCCSSQKLPLGCKGGPVPRRRHGFGRCPPALNQLELRGSTLLLSNSLQTCREHGCWLDGSLERRMGSAHVKWAERVVRWSFGRRFTVSIDVSNLQGNWSAATKRIAAQSGHRVFSAVLGVLGLIAP